MNNIGKIVFGCIAAAIIVVAIILLIPWGMSAESATEVFNNTKSNIDAKSATAKYLQMDNEYGALYLYNEKALGSAEGDVIGRIDFFKAMPTSDGTADPVAYSSGSIIIGKMKLASDVEAKWYVIKTATSTSDATKGYAKFDTKDAAVNYVSTNFPQAASLIYLLDRSLKSIMDTFTAVPEGAKVLGGSKAIAGAATVVIGDDAKTFTETLQISSDLIKKATMEQKSGDETVTQSYTFKYNGELKMVESLIAGLDEFEYK